LRIRLLHLFLYTRYAYTACTTLDRTHTAYAPDPAALPLPLPPHTAVALRFGSLVAHIQTSVCAPSLPLYHRTYHYWFFSRTPPVYAHLTFSRTHSRAAYYLGLVLHRTLPLFCLDLDWRTHRLHLPLFHYPSCCLAPCICLPHVSSRSARSAFAGCLHHLPLTRCHRSRGYTFGFVTPPGCTTTFLPHHWDFLFRDRTPFAFTSRLLRSLPPFHLYACHRFVAACRSRVLRAATVLPFGLRYATRSPFRAARYIPFTPGTHAFYTVSVCMDLFSRGSAVSPPGLLLRTVALMPLVACIFIFLVYLCGSCGCLSRSSFTPPPAYSTHCGRYCHHCWFPAHLRLRLVSSRLGHDILGSTFACSSHWFPAVSDALHTRAPHTHLSFTTTFTPVHGFRPHHTPHGLPHHVYILPVAPPVWTGLHRTLPSHTVWFTFVVRHCRTILGSLHQDLVCSLHLAPFFFCTAHATFFALRHHTVWVRFYALRSHHHAAVLPPLPFRSCTRFSGHSSRVRTPHRAVPLTLHHRAAPPFMGCCLPTRHRLALLGHRFTSRTHAHTRSRGFTARTRCVPDTRIPRTHTPDALHTAHPFRRHLCALHVPAASLYHDASRCRAAWDRALFRLSRVLTRCCLFAVLHTLLSAHAIVLPAAHPQRSRACHTRILRRICEHLFTLALPTSRYTIFAFCTASRMRRAARLPHVFLARFRLTSRTHTTRVLTRLAHSLPHAVSCTFSFSRCCCFSPGARTLQLSACTALRTRTLPQCTRVWPLTRHAPSSHAFFISAPGRVPFTAHRTLLARCARHRSKEHAPRIRAAHAHYARLPHAHGLCAVRTASLGPSTRCRSPAWTGSPLLFASLRAPRGSTPLPCCARTGLFVLSHYAITFSRWRRFISLHTPHPSPHLATRLAHHTAGSHIFLVSSRIRHIPHFLHCATLAAPYGRLLRTFSRCARCPSHIRTLHCAKGRALLRILTPLPAPAAHSARTRTLPYFGFPSLLFTALPKTSRCILFGRRLYLV